MAKVKASAKKQYDPSAKYVVGDKISHKIWDDSGVVTEVSKTLDGIAWATVEFETVGLKKLCMGTDLKLG